MVDRNSFNFSNFCRHHAAESCNPAHQRFIIICGLRISADENNLKNTRVGLICTCSLLPLRRGAIDDSDESCFKWASWVSTCLEKSYENESDPRTVAFNLCPSVIPNLSYDGNRTEVMASSSDMVESRERLLPTALGGLGLSSGVGEPPLLAPLVSRADF